MFINKNYGAIRNRSIKLLLFLNKKLNFDINLVQGSIFMKSNTSQTQISNSK